MPAPLRGWACRAGGSPCMTEQPVAVARTRPAASACGSAAASGAATCGRSRWDSRSAFPRVSPARRFPAVCGRSAPWRGQGCGCLCGPNPTGRIWGHAGRGTNAPDALALGIRWSGIPLRRRRRSALRTGRGTGRAAGRVSVAAWPTSTWLRRLPCTRWRARRCWRRWTRGGPTPPGSTGRAGGPGCCSTRRAETAAEAVGCRPDELTFTPSGTAAVHTGIAGALAGRRRTGRHLVVSAVEHSAVLHAARGPRGGRRHGGRGRGGPDRPGGAGGVRARRCGRTPRWPASSRPTTRSARCSRSPRWPRRAARAGVPLLVDAAQSLGWGRGGGRLVAAGGERPQVGRAGRGRAAGGAQGRPVRGPRARPTSGSRGRAPGFENLPAIVAAAASLRAVRAEAAAEAVRLRGAGGPDPRPGAAAGAGRGGGGRSGAPAAAPGHLLLSLRRRGGAAGRAGPARASPCPRVPPARRAR